MCRGLKNLLGALARGHVLLFVVVDLVFAVSGGGDWRERTHFFYILGMCVCVCFYVIVGVGEGRSRTTEGEVGRLIC